MKKESNHKPPENAIKPPPPPAPPPLRLIRESWSACGICQKCGSTVERRFIFIDKKRCINDQCGFGKGETEK